MTRLLSIWIVHFTLVSWLIDWTGSNPVTTHHAADSTNNNQQPQPQEIVDDGGGTIIIAAASPELVLAENDEQSQSPTKNPAQTQFNIRRRDMFFEDYSVKQIQVVDTVAITNNSINNISKVKTYVSKKSTTTSAPSPPPPPPPSSLIPDESPSISSIINSNQIMVAKPANPNPVVAVTEDPFKNQTVLMIGGDHIKELLLKPQRGNILLPKLEQTGKPACLQTPDDTYCENVDNYPKSIIKEEVYFSSDQFSEIFGNKEIDGRTIMDVENDESVCGKTPRVIFPKMAKNQANQWIYVVNEVEYTQAVVAEICERPGKPCTYMENLPLGMVSKCKQKYSYKRLLALHPTEKRTYPDAFRFPSCCACYIKIMDDFLARSNFRKIDKPIRVVDSSSSASVSSSISTHSKIKLRPSAEEAAEEMLDSPSSLNNHNNNNNNNNHNEDTDVNADTPLDTVGSSIIIIEDQTTTTQISPMINQSVLCD